MSRSTAVWSHMLLQLRKCRLRKYTVVKYPNKLISWDWQTARA